MAAGGAEHAARESDEILVERLRSGDRASFEALYDRYFPRIYSFVDKRVATREDAEEIVQEVFINLFSSIHSFRGEAPFPAWLFGLTRRTLANRFKKKRVETFQLQEDAQEGSQAVRMTSSEGDPHEAYEFRERLERMDAAITKELSAEQWLLFQLHHLQHRSIQEIAQSISKSEDAVKSHLYRARKLLLAR